MRQIAFLLPFVSSIPSPASKQINVNSTSDEQSYSIKIDWENENNLKRLCLNWCKNCNTCNNKMVPLPLSSDGSEGVEKSKRYDDSTSTRSSEERHSMLKRQSLDIEEQEEDEEDLEYISSASMKKRKNNFVDQIRHNYQSSITQLKTQRLQFIKLHPRLSLTRLALFTFFLLVCLIIGITAVRRSSRRVSEYDWDNYNRTGDNAFSTLPESVQNQLSLPALSEADKRDRTMSDEQCREEFPLFYPQLDELMRYWQSRGGVSKGMLDENEKGAEPKWGHVRLIIHRGKVYIRSFKEGAETRNSALVHLIQQAIESWPGGGVAKEDDLPTIDLILSPGDRDMFPNEAAWSVTKSVKQHKAAGRWLIPDFGFVGWPEAGIASFEEFLDQANDQEKQYPWYRKHTRAFWRGFANVYAVRKDLIMRTETKKHPERERWADVHETTFHPDSSKDFYPLVTLPEHCQYKYLVHAEGNSYSGRSRYLFSCHSVTIAHPLEWTQHFHPALNYFPTSPDQNYVQLPGPFFNKLEEVIHELRISDGMNDPKMTFKEEIGKNGQIIPPQKVLGINGAQKIADNAHRTLRHRYLTPAGTMCYTRAAFRHYAESLNVTSWGTTGPKLKPGHGILPDTSKGRVGGNVKGDIEVGVWRLLGGPDWPPR